MGGDSERLCYGLSDSYRITISDLLGKKLGAFSLMRKRGRVDRNYLKKFLGQWGDPPDVVERWAKDMPDRLTHFGRIEIHNGLIYVYKTQFGSKARENQQIDIFSLRGEYLYRALLKPGRGLTIHSPVNGSILIKGGYLTMAVQDDAGERRIIKYGISLPKGE